MDNNLLYANSSGIVAALTVRGGYEDGECEWNILGSTVASACDDALDYADNPALLDEPRDTDMYGNFITMEPGWHPCWYQSELHSDGFIPVGTAVGVKLPWYRHLDRKVPTAEGDEGQFEFVAASKEQVRRSLEDLWDIIFALSDHPQFDNKYTKRPVKFDVSRLDSFFALEDDAQDTAASARRTALHVVGWISWFMSCVRDWVSHVNSATRDAITQLHLARFSKHGFLVKLNRDWSELDFKFLVESEVPLLYMWGLFESNDRRFRRLTPSLIIRYHEEVKRAGRPIFDRDSSMLQGDFDVCRAYTPYLELRGYKPHLPELPFPDPNSAGLQVAIIDREGWERRVIAKTADWATYPKLYHYIVVEDALSRTTTVVFWRFRPCEQPVVEPESVDNIVVDYEEDVEEEDRSEVHERYKGHCAPRAGQIFDPITGVERRSPYEGGDKLERFEQEVQLLGRAAAFGARSLKDRLGPESERWTVDLTHAVRLDKRPPSSAGSNTHSERRQEDSSCPMGFQSEWAHLLANAGSTVNYVQTEGRKYIEFDPSKRAVIRQTVSPRPSDRSRSRSPVFRSIRSLPPLQSSGASIQAEPEPSQTIVLPRTMEYHLNWSDDEIGDMRGAWLRNFGEFGAALTFTGSLWKTHPGAIWNSGFLKDGYLMLSKSSKVRLRYWALTDATLEYPCHLLWKAIEHGVPFRIGLTSAAAARYRPHGGDPLNNVIMKQVVEFANKAPRIPRGLGPIELFNMYSDLLDAALRKPNAREAIVRGGGASWITRFFGYSDRLVSEFMSGPSVQVTMHRGGGNDLGDLYPKDVSWDELSERDLNIIFGYVAGDKPVEDAWIFPMDDTFQELSDHFHYEWTPGCNRIFRYLGDELIAGRGKARTRKEWREFFKTTNHGPRAPRTAVTRQYINETWDRLQEAFGGIWNKQQLPLIEIRQVFRPRFH
ncbi:hypothetical protein C8J57DRAFT_1518108 [Mycena rebaudengoi]|nr:hypothetical protein C8J57DRAFT_1518108 [Mycena rebaudengoi]